MPKRSVKFQFQLGAIGSTSLRDNMSAPSDVSIPAWCDWEPLSLAESTLATAAFQFQLGAIGSRSTTQKFKLTLNELASANVLFLSLKVVELLNRIYPRSSTTYLKFFIFNMSKNFF